MMPTAMEDLMGQFAAKESEARAANIKRKQQIESIFDEIITRYGPSGTYGEAARALLERQKVRDVGATAQRDISRGMYGIRPYEAEWEAEVGAPARLKLEDIMMQRLSQAQVGKAGFLERIEEPYPDYGAIMQSMATAGAGGGGRGGGGTTSFPSSRTTGLSERWQGQWEQFQKRGLGWKTPTVGGIASTAQEKLPEDFYKWYRAGFESPEKYAEFVGRPGAGQETISEASPEYQAYLRSMQQRQPGAVTATPTEYKKIQQRLKKKYPQYGQPVGGAAAAYRPQTGYGTFGGRGGAGGTW